MAEIIRQMDEDVIKYQGVQAKKPLGPDLNLPVEEEESSDELSGADRTSGNAVADKFCQDHATIRVTGDTTTSVEPSTTAVEPSTASIAANRSAAGKTGLALSLRPIPLGEACVAGKVAPTLFFSALDLSPVPAKLSSDFLVNTAKPSAADITIAPTICSSSQNTIKSFDISHVVKNRNQSGGLLFSTDAINPGGPSIPAAVLKGTCSQNSLGSRFVQNEGKIDFSHLDLLTGPQNTGYRPFNISVHFMVVWGLV